MVWRDKSGSEAETGRKRRRNRYGLHTGSLGSTRERDWVVGSQILTHPILQCVNVDSLPVELTKELVLFFVHICIPCMVTLSHSLSIRLDLGQVLLHLSLLLLQSVPLKIPKDQSKDRNEGWGLTLVLSPAKRPQSLPTSTAEYLMD